MCSIGGESAEEFNGGDDGAGVKWDFGKRNDGDEDAHYDRESTWITGRSNDIGSDFVHNPITKLQQISMIKSHFV